MSLSRENLSSLCRQAASDQHGEVNVLVDHVYDTLHRMALRQMGGERCGHTLSPTALVHEAYLRLVDQDRLGWQDRGHFLAIAARVMRRVLIDHARRRLSSKRGGGQAMVTFNEEAVAGSASPESLIELDSALDRLETLSPRQRQIVEMRFFGGMTHQEVAAVTGVSEPTVRRDWRLAQAWLKREMSG